MRFTIGIIGLGIMGSAIATNMLGNDYEVVGCDIDPSKMDKMEKEGVKVVASPLEVAQQSDVILTSLPNVKALDDVINGKDGLVGCEQKDLVVFEASTFPIADKERARDMLASAGIVLMDCPLSGTGSQARAGDLSVYVSGEKSAYERFASIFDGFSRSHFYLGEFGNASRMKFIANLLVAIHNVSTAEAFVLGQKAGLDPKTILEVITDGAGKSRMFEVRGPMMAKNDYSGVTMSVKMWQKDMKIIGEFAASLGSPAPLFAACGPIYHAAMSQGHANDDTASVCAVLESMANIARS